MKTFAKTSVLVLLMLAIVSCESSNTDKDYDSGASDIYVSDDSSGRVVLNIVDSTLAVADTTGFTVAVLDAQGKPVSGIKIYCDTEADLALIEPSSGVFLTGGSGVASGRIGCEDHGSFQMACSLTVGGGKRQMETIKCEGDRPDGFTGWADAGGGTLGNGVADTTDVVRVLEVSFEDAGNTDTVSIDIEQGTCGTGTTATPEIFTDTMATFKVENSSARKITLTSYKYTVRQSEGVNGFGPSNPIQLNTVIDAGGSGDASALFCRADSTSGLKYFYGDSNNIQPGFNSITFELSGFYEDGETFEISVKTTLSFDNFNNC